MKIYEDIEDNTFNACNTSDMLNTMTVMEEDLSQLVQNKDIKVEEN